MLNNFKACLVAKDFSQQFGVDYHAIFAPIVARDAALVLVTSSNDRYLHLRSIDVRTAFMHAPLEKEGRMAIPQGAWFREE